MAAITQFNYDFKEMVELKGNEVTTTSLHIAKHFNKEHSKVMRAVRKLIKETGDWGAANFGVRFKINKLQNGQQQEFYEITKDGFMLLVMGFTGKKALAVKLAFINAFNEMAAVLQNSRQSLQSEMNSVMLEYMKEKDVASMSGRLLSRWGKQKKPALLARIDSLEKSGQLMLM